MRVSYERITRGLLVLGLLVAATELRAATPQIDGGEGYSCGLGASGRAFCWGTNTASQTGSGLGMPFQLFVSRPTEIAGSFVTIASGREHSCGLQADGSAYCWGQNRLGQVGNGTLSPAVVSLPVRVQTSVRFKSITVGAEHTCAIDLDNLAWCWGSNDSSQLGRVPASSPSTGTLFSTTPVLVLPNSSSNFVEFQSISAGSQHTCAIDLSGAAWCWGSNLLARAGIDVNLCGGAPVTTQCDFFRPVMTVASSSFFNLRFTSISAGDLNTCGIDTVGFVHCWGASFLRGRSFTGSPDHPTDVPHVSNFAPAVSVSAGSRSVCAVSGTGELFCWGNHDHGQLGNGAPISPSASSVTPVRVAGPQDYASVAVGAAYACARTLTDSARCWGFNNRHQLGIDSMPGPETNVPMSVIGLGTTLVTTGAAHVCSLDAAGVVACWGDNSAGQIGHGLTGTPPPTSSVVPTPVARFYRVPRPHGFPPPNPLPPEQLSNTMPPTKDQMGAMDFTRLSVGGQHACALNAAGNAYCWGRDFVGQVGNGRTNPVACRFGKEMSEGETPSCVPYPTIVSREDGHLFADISAGGAHNCARNRSGIVSCWGSANFGELGSTTTATCPGGACLRRPTQIEVPFPYRIQMLDVSAGDAASCAVNGSDVFCWGAMTGTKTPVPMKVPSGPNYVRIGTGARHACTGFPNMSMMCFGYNGFGELGDGTNTPSWTGTQPGFGMPFVPASLSWASTCGVDPLAGGVQCWGMNGSGQLGDGTTSNNNFPQITLLPPKFVASAIGSGFDHACAIDSAGFAHCWGDDHFAQLGDGSLQTKPVTVPVSVAAGWRLP